VATIFIIFVRINLSNFVHFTKQRQYRQHSGNQARRGQSPPEAESLWPQSSDNQKHGEQTVTTAITTTRNLMLKLS